MYEPRREKIVFFCICKNKDADQLRGNREADQRLCFRYIESTIPLLPIPKFQGSSHLLWLYRSVCVGPGRKPRRPVFSERGSNVCARRTRPIKNSHYKILFGLKPSHTAQTLSAPNKKLTTETCAHAAH